MREATKLVRIKLVCLAGRKGRKERKQNRIEIKETRKGGKKK